MIFSCIEKGSVLIFIAPVPYALSSQKYIT